MKMKAKKATGPDGIRPRLLKSCAPVQDCEVPLEHEPEAGKSANAVENLLRVTSTKEPSPKGLH